MILELWFKKFILTKIFGHSILPSIKPLINYPIIFKGSNCQIEKQDSIVLLTTKKKFQT